MKYLLIIISVAINALSFSQAKYVYDEVPDSLKKNADYVVWEDKMEFEISDIGKATEKVKFAVCVIDQHSTRFNKIYVNYKKNEPVKKFNAEIYDKNGELVKKLKNNDIKDMSAVSGYSLFEDDRVLMALFTHNQYPYTLVYEYEKKVDGLLHYNSKYFQGAPNLSVIYSEFKVIIPNGLKLRYKEYNLNNKVDIQQNDKTKTYKWTESLLKAYEPNELPPPIEHYQPIVHTAPIQFSQGGVVGDMKSWESFGFWRWNLNKGRDVLPEDAVSKVKSLTSPLKTEREKIKTLYSFVQNNTRYVSVQEGVGGWQAFPAEFVYKNGYGDCKALSNYMYALLKSIGIKSLWYIKFVYIFENADW